MAQRTTLAELLADPKSSAPAIIAVDPLSVVSYKALAEQIERLAEQLRSAGLRAGESVAIVLPNGLEFLVVFLALTRARLVAAPQPGLQGSRTAFFPGGRAGTGSYHGPRQRHGQSDGGGAWVNGMVAARGLNQRRAAGGTSAGLEYRRGTSRSRRRCAVSAYQRDHQPA